MSSNLVNTPPQLLPDADSVELKVLSFQCLLLLFLLLGIVQQSRLPVKPRESTPAQREAAREGSSVLSGQ